MDSRVYNYGHARPVAVGSARSLGVVAEVGAGAEAGAGDGDEEGEGIVKASSRPAAVSTWILIMDIII